MIVNLANGKFYIGSTKRIYYRANEHRTLLRGGKHFNQHLQRAFNKYGDRSFAFIPIRVIDVSDYALRLIEESFIKSLCPDYNIQTVVKGYAKMKFSAEHRAKLSASNRRRKGKYKMSAEARANMSAAQKNLMKTDPDYIEKKRRAGRAGKGRKMSEETKKKLSEAAKRRWRKSNQ